MKVCSALQNRCCRLQAKSDFNIMSSSPDFGILSEKVKTDLKIDGPELDNTDMQRLTYLAETEI